MKSGYEESFFQKNNDEILRPEDIGTQDDSGEESHFLNNEILHPDAIGIQHDT